MKNIPVVSIKIMQAIEISFTLKGAFTCNNSIKNIKGDFTAKIDGDRLKLKCEQFEYHSENTIIFSPCSFDSDFFELKEVVIGIDFHWEQKENQQFQGQLKLLVIMEIFSQSTS
jgi:stage II sporulation protein D